ncbi:AAA family ATPase, partial [Rhizobium johnstonii]|uniref:AAA family ATPase n=1 Tax=Rhizobium johnstonii TaxID=3019933 RepID=UPI003F9CFE4A
VRSLPTVGGQWHDEKVTSSSPVMIGRASELARLNEALVAVRQGAPLTIVIGGEAGIGKTRLIGEATEPRSTHWPRTRCTSPARWASNSPM